MLCSRHTRTPRAWASRAASIRCQCGPQMCCLLGCACAKAQMQCMPHDARAALTRLNAAAADWQRERCKGHTGRRQRAARSGGLGCLPQRPFLNARWTFRSQATACRLQRPRAAPSATCRRGRCQPGIHTRCAGMLWTVPRVPALKSPLRCQALARQRRDRAAARRCDLCAVSACSL